MSVDASGFSTVGVWKDVGDENVLIVDNNSNTRFSPGTATPITYNSTYTYSYWAKKVKGEYIQDDWLGLDNWDYETGLIMSVGNGILTLQKTASGQSSARHFGGVDMNGCTFSMKIKKVAGTDTNWQVMGKNSGGASTGATQFTLDGTDQVFSMTLGSGTTYVTLSSNYGTAGTLTVNIDWIRITGGCFGSPFRFQLEGRDASNVTQQTIGVSAVDKFEWQKFLYSGSYSNATITKVYPWFSNGADLTGYTRTLYIKKPMMEANPFASPWTGSTRGASTLVYNLNGSIGLDWSGNWSICYWKKPMGTVSGLTGYNIDTIGNAGTGAGTSYLWFGKNTGSNTLTITNTVNFGTWTSNYFRTWQFISLVKTGTTLVVTITGVDFGGSGSIAFSPTASGPLSTGLSPNFDFELGGYYNNRHSLNNSYFRDLLVVKRAMTASELQAYRTATRIKTDSIQAPLMIEGGF
jgi:hypothetical protein